ncbi:MAG TPA: RNA degradosome polyphosphate kinase, partial [bacterium]|nr:RNA degradosome polyphosphate kinase [bacterium]
MVARKKNLKKSELFINRETSWLEFNRRVLFEALDKRNPLLERVKFLAIFSSNLDEFFMKRVGGLKRQSSAGVTRRTIDGLTPHQQLSLIRQLVIEMVTQQRQCLVEEIFPTLRQQGITILAYGELDKQQ